MADLKGNSVDSLADAFAQAEQRKDFFYEPSSRLQMLEKLEHLSRFSDFLLLVTGPVGSGKTVLIRQLQAAPSDRTLRLCAVDGRQTPSLNGLLIALSKQLSPELDTQADNQAMLNAIYSFAQVMAAEHIQWVIIIDNADELEKAAIKLLLQMLSEAQGLPIKPHLLLAAGENFQAQLQTYDEYELLDAQVHQLRLEPFTFTEARSYLLQRYSAAASLSEKQLQAVYAAAGGYPGGLNRQVEQLLRSGSVQKTTKPATLTRVHFVGIAVVLLAVLLGSLWQYWPESDVGTTRTQVEIQVPIEAEAVIAQADETSPVTVLETDHLVYNESQSTDSISVPITDVKPGLQSEVLQQETTLASTLSTAIEVDDKPEMIVSGDTSKPVVQVQPSVPAAIPQPAIQPVEPSKLEPAKIEPQPEAKPTPVKPVVKPVQVVSKPAAVVSKPVKTASVAKPAATVVASSALTEAEQTLLQWPASGYTLQMLGAGKRSSAEQFIQAQAEPQKFYMFQTRYKNKPWFVVVYGQYKDRNAAHAAATALPSALTKLKPWARTIQGIQADITTRK